MDTIYPTNYGQRSGKYEARKDSDGYWRVYRLGANTTDGQIKFTKSQINVVLKYYEGLEYSTGEVRTDRGEWWPGVPFIAREDRKYFGEEPVRTKAG